MVTRMSGLVKRLLCDENGATAIEYGLIVALIAVAIMATVSMIGGQIQTTFEVVIDKLAAA